VSPTSNPKSLPSVRVCRLGGLGATLASLRESS
jgi:hypothetical protein